MGKIGHEAKKVSSAVWFRGYFAELGMMLLRNPQMITIFDFNFFAMRCRGGAPGRMDDLLCNASFHRLMDVLPWPDHSPPALPQLYPIVIPSCRDSAP
jgi:hypothetical protein